MKFALVLALAGLCAAAPAATTKPSDGVGSRLPVPAHIVACLLDAGCRDGVPRRVEARGDGESSDDGDDGDGEDDKEAVSVIWRSFTPVQLGTATAAPRAIRARGDGDSSDSSDDEGGEDHKEAVSVIWRTFTPVQLGTATAAPLAARSFTPVQLGTATAVPLAIRSRDGDSSDSSDSSDDEDGEDHKEAVSIIWRTFTPVQLGTATAAPLAVRSRDGDSSDSSDDEDGGDHREAVSIIWRTFTPVQLGTATAAPLAVRFLDNEESSDSSDDEDPIATFTIGHQAVKSTATSTPPAPTGSPSSEDKTNASLDADSKDFMAPSTYSRLAREQTAPYPYEQVFADQNATAIHQPIVSRRTDTYDAEVCAGHCNVHRACKSFGIFIERQASCSNCTRPSSTEVNMCELYNTPLDRDIITATDTQNQTLTRAIRASNGYNKLRETHTVTATRTLTITVRSHLHHPRTIDPLPPLTATRQSLKSTTTLTAIRPTSTATTTKYRTRIINRPTPTPKPHTPDTLTVTLPGVTTTTKTKTRTRYNTSTTMTHKNPWPLTWGYP